jgi:hypothetical protein
MATKLIEIEPGARNVVSEAAGGRLWLVPLSVEQYHGMIDGGFLPEDTSIELLDGMLVPKDRGDAGGDPMTIGDEHWYVVNRLADLAGRIDRRRSMIQTQQPVSIPEASGEPEPDAAIVLRPARTPGKPTAAEVSCVIEVAGTSLRRDRTTKLRHYARGGIPQYVVVNLADRTAEEYLLPRPQDGVYAESVVHAAGATLRLRLAGDERLDVPLADLLPPR